ncbi:MAG: 50S ribosomal protein L10 [Candidatus Jorgensenbacteria bacterium]
MKTKAQKQQAVEEGLAGLKGSKTIVIADFTGISTSEMNVLRKALRGIGAAFHVVKKRLLRIIFEKEGIAMDPRELEGQMGVVFSPNDLVETAGVVHRFSRGKELLKFLGGVEVKEKKFIEGADVKRIGALPSREVLLGQLAYMLTVPIKKFLFVLSEKSKK